MCNKNTRVAYLHAVDRFFTWCERHRIGDLADIEPLRVAAYIEALEKQLREANRQAAPGRDPYAVEP
jgi:site-specific recombinase XerD